MKYPSLTLGSPRAIAFRQAGMFLILLIVNILLNNLNLTSSDLYWIALTIALGVFGYFPFLLFCQALQSGAVGVVNSIGNSFPIIVVALSYFFLNLEISLPHLFGILLTTFGIVLLSVFSLPQKKLSSKTLYTSTQVTVFSLAACFLWGIFFTLVQIPNRELGFMKFATAVQLGSFFSAYLHLLLQKFKTKKNYARAVGKKSLKTLILASICAVTGSVCFYKALSLGNPGIVTAIAGCSPVVGSIFGKIVYKEILSTKQKFGIFLSVVGVMILGFFK